MREPMIPNVNIDDCTYRMIMCWPKANEDMSFNNKDRNDLNVVFSEEKMVTLA